MGDKGHSVHMETGAPGPGASSPNLRHLFVFGGAQTDRID